MSLIILFSRKVESRSVVTGKVSESERCVLKTTAFGIDLR